MYKTVDSFLIFDYFESMPARAVLFDFGSWFFLPTYDLSKANQADRTFEDSKQFNTLKRDLNIVQTSSAVLGDAHIEIRRMQDLVKGLLFEVFNGLDRTLSVWMINRNYQMQVSKTVLESGRIYLASTLEARMIETEIKGKEGLWALRVYYYGTIVMAAIMRASKYLGPTKDKKTEVAKAISVASWGMMGAQIGTYIYPGIGTAIGAVIGIIVGIALEFL